MLVLTRRSGERIKIGADVWVTVVRTGRSVVRVGIDAPDDVAIIREELDIPQPAKAACQAGAALLTAARRGDRIEE